MKINFLIYFIPLINGFLIPSLKTQQNYLKINETRKDDSAMIPKKDIPKHPLIWKPKTNY